MACGEPQWWYDLVKQELADQQVFSQFIGEPLFDNVRDVQILRDIECITAEDILGTLELSRDYPEGEKLPIRYEENPVEIPLEEVTVFVDKLTEDDIVRAYHVEDEDTLDAAYERAMKGI